MNTGHDGSITTVHANSPRDSLSRLETLVLMAGVDLPVRAIREQVAGAVDLVIQQARLKDGSRRVVAISEVAGMESDVITMQDIFTFNYGAGRDENGRFQGGLDQHWPAAEVRRGAPRPGHRAAAQPVRQGDVVRGTHSPRRRSKVRAALALVAGVLVAGIAAPSAGAAPEPGTASLSSVRLNNGTFTGVLTVRAGQMPVAVDPTSLKAIVAGRTYPVTVKPLAQLKRATMLVVDTSGSMGEPGMATVRTAVAAFLKSVPDDVSVGLVSFAATAGVDVPPTKDRARLQKAVNALRSRGETTLYDGVAVAASALNGYDERSILLLSDGGDTRSVKATKASATAALKRAGVRAEVIGFKTGDSDNSVLKGFAAAGGGNRCCRRKRSRGAPGL